MFKGFILSVLAVLSLNTQVLALQANAAPNTNGLAAVVNEQVITQADLDGRFQLLLQQVPANFPEAQHQALQRKALNDLINESLYRDYAKTNNIKVEPQEINLAIAQIEKGNNMAAGTLKKMPAAAYQSLQDKIVADLLWQKIIAERLRPRVNVSTSEVDQIIRSVGTATTGTEYELAQIEIVTREKDNAASKEEIERIYKELQGGADFQALAKTFSEGPFAAAGGYMGWFAGTEMPPAVAQLAQQLQVGAISLPQQAPEGWYILKLLNKRQQQPVPTTPVKEVQLFRFNALKTDDSQAMKARLTTLEKTRDVHNTIQAQRVMATMAPQAEFAGTAELGWLRLTDTPSDIRAAVEKLDVGETSGVIETDTAFSVVFLADSRDIIAPELEALRNRIRSRIGENRLELSARQLLRNLRRQAYIRVF